MNSLKHTALLGLCGLSLSASAEPLCDVQVCNKLERATLSITKMMKDSLGESCTWVKLPKSQAVPGKELSHDSRWFQGSFNPTKASVTRVKTVGDCQ